MPWHRFRFGRTMQHLRRYRHILTVVMKYGLDDLAGGMRHRLRWRLGAGVLPRRVARYRDGRSRPQRLRMALEELGPTFIKLGQLLSTRPDLVGPEYIVELEKLQDQVPPVPFEEIRREIELQLGGTLEKLFASFDPAPLAAASIAQVHKAVLLDGTVVAVKARRPGIVGIIRTECEILGNLAQLVASAMGRNPPIDPVRVVHEFTDAVTREVDLSNELQNLQQFIRNFEGDAAVHIPRPYEPYCRSAVLTMEYIEGVKPVNGEVLLAVGLDPCLVADRGSNFVLRQVFEFGLFHTDPHPGNLFILPQNVLGPLDFGQVAALTASDRALLGDVILAVVDADASRMVRGFSRADMLTAATNTTHLQRDLEKMLEKYHGLPIKEIPFAPMMMQIFSLVREHRILLPPEFTLMLKCLVTMEAMAVSLDGNFQIIEHLQPYARRLNLEQLDPRRWLRTGMHSMRDAADLLTKLPDDVNVILDKLKHGQFQMHFQHEHLDDLVNTLDKSSNRISFGLIIAGLLIASSLLVPQERVLLNFLSLQTMGVLGYLAAAVMGLWLLVSILRSRRL